MTQRIVFVILMLVHLSSQSQEHQFLNEREILVENGIYKMIQYDVLDSTAFRKEFSNGYYSIYNEEGSKVKSNAYRSFISKDGTAVNEEYINFYMYDSLNTQIGFIQMFPEQDEPFNIISLKSISLEENSVQKATLESGFTGSNFIFEEYDYTPTRKAIGDTIKISESHSRSYGVRDSAFYLDIFYAENGSIDSTIYHTKCNGQLRSMKCSTKTVFSYSEKGNVLSKFYEYRSSTSKVNPYLTKEIQYLGNGLIDSIKTVYLNPSIDETTWSKFEYEIKEDQ